MKPIKTAFLLALPLGLAACAPVVISASDGGVTISPVGTNTKPVSNGNKVPVAPISTSLSPSQMPCSFEMNDLVREQYGSERPAYQRVASLCDTDNGRHSSRNMQSVARNAEEIEVCNSFVFNQNYSVRGGLRPMLPAYSNARLISSSHYNGRQFRVETNGQTRYHSLSDGTVRFSRVSNPSTIVMQGKQPMGAGNYYVFDMGKTNFNRGDTVRFCAIYR